MEHGVPGANNKALRFIMKTKERIGLRITTSESTRNFSNASVSLPSIEGGKFTYFPSTAGYLELAKQALNTYRSAVLDQSQRSYTWLPEARETISHGVRAKGKYNECQHYIGSFVSEESYLALQAPTTDYWPPYFTGLCHYRTPPAAYWAPSRALIPMEYQTAARRRAWESLQPRFESDFKALTFIGEMKDYKNLLKLSERAARDPQSFYSTLRSVSRGGVVKERKLKDLAPRGDTSAGDVAYRLSGRISSAWLTYMLAYLPLMKDIAGISANLATTVAEEQSKFQDAGLTKQKRHYSEVLDETSTRLYTNSLLRVDDIVQLKYTATMEYTYDYRLRNARDAFIRYWGLTGSIDQFWNLVPWSFVVDYFLGIGRILEMMQRDPNVELRVLQYCESLKSKSAIQYSVLNSASYPILIVADKVIEPGRTARILSYGSSMYQRDLTAPTKIGLLVPRLKVPSYTQSLNMLALLRAIF